MQADRAAARIIRAGKNADVVVIGILDGKNERIVPKVRRALPKARIVVVSFGSPYLLSGFPDVDAYLCAYGFRGESELAAAQAVVGEFSPTGKLPVTLGAFPFGHGLTYDDAAAPVAGNN